MDNVRAFDKAIDAMGRFSLLAQLKDKLVEVLQTAKPECGNCYHWMKNRDCPREQNVDGRQRGPSMSAPACSKFKIEQSALDLRAKRIGEAVAFAKRHNLPIPYAHT